MPSAFLSHLTCPRTVTLPESTREGDGLEFFFWCSLWDLYVAVESCIFCSAVRMLHKSQSFLSTHGSEPMPLSQHLAHLLCPSKLAIICPHLPYFCPEEAKTSNEHNILVSDENKTKFEDIKAFLQTSRALQKHVCTLHMPNKKDA